MARHARPNGRHKPRTPPNLIYRQIGAAGGPTALAKRLGVSLPTLARWRREGRVRDAAAVLEWAGLLYPKEPGKAYRLARRLAGLGPRPRAG